MSKTTAFAVYATGIAMLADEESAMQQLVELAGGRSDDLEDARDLLYTVRADPDLVARADLLIERAVTRVAQADDTVEESQRVRHDAHRVRVERSELREAAERLRDSRELPPHLRPCD